MKNKTTFIMAAITMLIAVAHAQELTPQQEGELTDIGVQYRNSHRQPPSCEAIS